MRTLAIFLCAFNLVFSLNSQDKPTPSPIIFIYDASGSMWGQIEGTTKMEIAASVLSKSVNNLAEDQKIGLMAYGHRRKGDCQDVEFLVDVENGTKAQVNQSLTKIKPLGKTPLAFSALQAIDMLRNSNIKATIILLTDGIESCGGNICDVIKAARKEGIDFKLHIIGFGLKAEETGQLKCAATAGDGHYYDAADAGGLGEVLNQATAATIDEPEGNFSVYTLKNGKAVDAIVRGLKQGSKTPVDVTRTYGDTSFLYLPPGTYNLEVTPLNSEVNAIVVSNVRSFEDKVAHQTISFDGGKIRVTTLNNDKGWDAAVTVYSKETGKNVARGRTYGKSDEFELNPGVFDVEVKALVMDGLETNYRIENVEVKANQVTEVGHTFKTGIAMIGAKSANGLVDAVVNILETSTRKKVAGGRTYTSDSSNPKKFILNPGTYEVTLTALGDHKGKKESFTIVVKQGTAVEKTISF